MNEQPSQFNLEEANKVLDGLKWYIEKKIEKRNAPQTQENESDINLATQPVFESDHLEEESALSPVETVTPIAAETTPVETVTDSPVLEETELLPSNEQPSVQETAVQPEAAPIEAAPVQEVAGTPVLETPEVAQVIEPAQVVPEVVQPEPVAQSVAEQPAPVEPVQPVEAALPVEVAQPVETTPVVETAQSVEAAPVAEPVSQSLEPIAAPISIEEVAQVTPQSVPLEPQISQEVIENGPVQEGIPTIDISGIINPEAQGNVLTPQDTISEPLIPDATTQLTTVNNQELPSIIMDTENTVYKAEGNSPTVGYGDENAIAINSEPVVMPTDTTPNMVVGDSPVVGPEAFSLSR